MDYTVTRSAPPGDPRVSFRSASGVTVERRRDARRQSGARSHGERSLVRVRRPMRLVFGPGYLAISHVRRHVRRESAGPRLEHTDETDG